MVRRSDEECSATQQLGSFCDAINEWFVPENEEWITVIP